MKILLLLKTISCHYNLSTNQPNETYGTCIIVCFISVYGINRYMSSSLSHLAVQSTVVNPIPTNIYGSQERVSERREGTEKKINNRILERGRGRADASILQTNFCSLYQIYLTAIHMLYFPINFQMNSCILKLV